MTGSTHHQVQAARSHLAGGRFDQAFGSLVTVLQHDAGHAEALTVLGLLQWRTGDRSGAVTCWRRAVQREPQHHEAATLLAEAALEAGSAREAAIQAERVIHSGDPRPDPWSTLIRALRQAGDPRVLPSLRQGLTRHPRAPDLLWHGCVIAGEARQYREAAMYAERLLAIQPDHAGAICTQVDAQARISDWAGAEAAHQCLLALVGNGGTEPGLVESAFAWDDPAILGQVTAAIAAQCPTSAGRPPRRPVGDRLTVCYLSPDLNAHPVGRMLLGVLPHHDRNRVRVITAGLSPPSADPIGSALRHHVDQHLDLCACSDGEAVARLQQAGVDVLVDLAGATTRNRYGILAARPAAAQILWLGCPTGTGGGWYDAFLVDDVVCPTTSAQVFREPLLRLPVCYHPMIGPDGTLPAITRAHIGLPDDAIVLACMHAPHKVRPPIVDVWLRLAQANPRVMLWLDALDGTAQDSIRRYASKHGVGAGQLRFWAFHADHRHYLATLALADLFLDCHPYGAHSTAGEALSVGVPVITPAGRCIHARVAASMLSQLGLNDCIRDGLADYEQHVTRLCGDPQLREALCEQTRRLVAEHLAGHAIRLTTSLEAAYRSVWEANA